MVMEFTQNLTGNSQFARSILRAGAKVIERELEDVGADAVRRCDAIVAAETVYGGKRPGRRVPNERHLLGSFDYTIETSGGEFPVSITLLSVARDEKVDAIENGPGIGYVIRARKTFLEFPHSQTGRKVRVKKVNHPGVKGIRMMARGLNSAVRAHYRTAIGERAARG